VKVKIVRSSEPKGFAQIPNAALRDERLSYKARGIHANLLSNSDDGWSETAESLAEKSPDGRDACRSGLRELAKYGYVEYRKVQGIGGKWSTEMIIYSSPRNVPAGRTEDGKPAPGATCKDDANPQVAPKTENPSSVEGDRSRETRPRSHQPKHEFPQVVPKTGYPDAGFPGPIQKTITEDHTEDHKTGPPVAPPRRSDRGTRLPEHFPVTGEMRTWAREHAPLCGTTDHDAFCDYWHSSPGAKGRKVDWVKTWRNWMRREQERRIRQQPRAAPSRPMATGDQRAAEIEALRAEMHGTRTPHLNVIRGELS
jgi:hypothetical protein